LRSKSFTRAPLLLLALSTVGVAAQAHEGGLPATSASVASAMAGATDDVRELMRHVEFVPEVLAALAGGDRDAVPLSEVTRQFDPGARMRASNRLRSASQNIRVLKGLPEQGADLLQVRMLLPEGTRWDDFALSEYRVAAVPVGEDRALPMVRTYAADGSVQEIPIDARPSFPLLLIEVDTRTALSEGLRFVNDGLRAQGLQSLPERSTRADTLDVTRLDRIRLAVDQEPDIKGAAEIFAIVSGLQVDQKKPELRTFEMPWLGYDKTDYYPQQDWIHWGNYRYDVANVQMFEEDGETNYKTMLSALVKVVGTVIGPVEPTVAAVSLIADSILTAMPDAWFVDEHDYVDSFYLLQRGVTYRARSGAGGNAVVDLTPITVGK